MEPGNDDHYAQDGPEPVPFQSGIPSLTAGVVNRPAGGDQPFSEPVGRPDHALGRDQSMGQGINPMLKPANAPRQPGEGLFK